MTNALAPLRHLAATQAGLVTRSQARALGVDRHRLARSVARGEWRALTPDVLAVIGAPATPRQSVLAATLAAGPGSALARQSAAAWLGLPGFPLLPATVARNRRTRRATLGPVYITNVWPAYHLTTHRGVPVTTAARTLADLTPDIHPQRLERALDTAWSQGLVSGPMLQQVIDDLRGQGRHNLDHLQSLLDERGGDWIPPASLLEKRFHHLVSDAGQPPFERRVVLGDDDGVIGEVDALDRAAGLIIEIDSDRFHASPTDAASDAARDARFAAIGLHVERVTEDELVRHPSRVLARIMRVRRERTTLIRPA